MKKVYMNRVFISCFLFFFAAFLSFGQIWEMDLPEINPGKLKSYIHVCASQTDTSKGLPLVIVLHGCSQNAEEIAELTEWNVLAEKYQFHVLYPEQQRKNNLTNCYNWFQANDRERDRGEVMSIRQQIEQAKRFLKIDTTQIFIFGLSAGAGMANAMLVCYPELFNAGALLAGPPYGQSLRVANFPEEQTVQVNLTPNEWARIAREQNPTYEGKYPKTIIMHGTRDLIVPYHWGIEVCDQWIGLNKTNVTPAKTDVDFQKANGLSRLSYLAEDSTEQVVFYSFEKWGHNISVDPGTEVSQGGKIGNFSKNGGFYCAYWIAKDFGLIKN